MSTIDLAAEKKSLRAKLRQRLMGIDPAELVERSVQAAMRLIESSEFRRARAIMVFLPLRYEIDARAIALRAWQDAKTVTVPLVSYQQKHMLPMEISSLDDPMDEDRFGVRSPCGGQPFPIDMIDLVVVPGLGFDRTGQRLGRGGGFYDRFLAQPTFQAKSCGLAMEEQLVPEVPVSPHDVSLDMLVTDQRIMRFRRHRA